MLWLDWGNDFQIAPNGGLVQANGWDEVRQLVVRAVLTNPRTLLPSGEIVPPDYVYEPNFGAGLGLYVGQDMNQTQITALAGSITTQVLALPQVDATKPPTISFTRLPNSGMLVQVTVYLNTGQVGTVTLKVA